MEDQKSADRFQALLVMAATAGTIAFNILAATGYVNGITPAEIAAKYPSVLTPASYAFSIWGMVYLGMAAFSVYQILPAWLIRYRNIRTLYILSCVLNCGWIYFWHREMIGFCLGVMASLAFVLLLINLKLGRVAGAGRALFTQAPFGLYFGWVTIGTFINFVVFLTSSGVEVSQTAWNVLGSVLLVIATALAFLVRAKLRNFLFPLAVAWASTAIAVQQRGNTVVILVAAICTIVCLVLSLSFVMDLPNSTHE